MSFRLFAVTAAIAVPLLAADPDPRLDRLKKLVPRVDLRKFLHSKRPGGAPSESGKCAHILLYVPPADLDKGIQQQNPPRAASGGQITPMPVCPQDVRQLKKPD